MNRDLLSIKSHPSKAIADAALGDPTIVNLAIGEASYGAPAEVLEAIAAQMTQRDDDDASADYNRYAHSRGSAKLRRAIAERYRRLYGAEVDPESEVVVTHGAAEAIWLAVFTLTNPGDEVLIPDPCYVLYEGIPQMLGRAPVRISTTAESGFRFDAEAVSRALTPKTRLLILNSPANPTGTVYDAATLASLHALAAERGFHILHDEVFDKFVFAGSHVPMLDFDPSLRHTVMANSLSKLFGMTGWRLGWMVAAPEVVAQALKAHTYMMLAVASVLQEAVADALNDPAVEAQVEARALRVRGRSLRMTAALEELGFTFPGGEPAGGFYLFPRVTGLHEALRLPSGGSVSQAVAAHLMQTSKVAVVPGNAYGPAGEGHVRLVAAAPDAVLDEALQRLRSVVPSKVAS